MRVEVLLMNDDKRWGISRGGLRMMLRSLDVWNISCSVMLYGIIDLCQAVENASGTVTKGEESNKNPSPQRAKEGCTCVGGARRPRAASWESIYGGNLCSPSDPFTLE